MAYSNLTGTHLLAVLGTVGQSLTRNCYKRPAPWPAVPPLDTLSDVVLASFCVCVNRVFVVGGWTDKFGVPWTHAIEQQLLESLGYVVDASFV